MTNVEYMIKHENQQGSEKVMFHSLDVPQEILDFAKDLSKGK